MIKNAAHEGALRAALVPQFTPRRWRRFLDRGGDPAWLGVGGASMLSSRLGIGRVEAAVLARALARARPERERTRALAAGARVVAWGEGAYPQALCDLPDPPCVVYQRGEYLECDARAVVVTGARRATPYGLRVARALAGDLARAGVTVVAGMVRGIDATAHEAALAAGGRTIAVLGSGLLRPPTEHVDLMERVVRQGVLMSEFPLDAPPSGRSFPQRARVIAALGLATVVVEAGGRSGALTTARHALDLGRSVLAVPGPIDSLQSSATLRMLQDGAAPCGSATDVFAALGWCDLPPSELPSDERAVLDALGETGRTAAAVALETGLPEEAAAGYLVTLEVRGLVAREGGRYVPA